MDPLSQLLMSLESADKESAPDTTPMLPGLRLLPANTKQLSPEGEARGSKNKSQGKKICSFWYHGHCTKSSSNCKFLHQTEGSSNVLSYRPRATHGPACGLDLCCFKEPPTPRAESDVVQHDTPKSSKRKRRDSLIEDRTSTQHPPNKRKSTTLQHWDAPFATKAQTIDYDDAEAVEDTSQTCFFWYHGGCGKQRDALRGMGPPCARKHELTDPPSMVQPPPGYIHDEPCSREWCPGDEKKKEKPKKQLKTSSPPRSLQEDETCFFWYHGNCARSLDPRNRRGCPYKHELTDPPSMVQPPPGYTHREPCGREWCPGDAREKMSLKATAIGGGAETAVEEGGDGWFLDGFD